MNETQTAWSPGVQDTITAALARAVAKHPDRIFLDIVGETFTYLDIDNGATRLARGLQQLGVKPGETVTTVLDNNVDAIIAWLAINKLGAISVPLNTANKGEFLRHQAADSGARVIIAESDYAERVAALAQGLTELHTVLVRGRMPEAETSGKTFAPLDSARVSGAGALPDPNQPSDLAMLIYTAGTTGPSKGCMISHNYACNLARQAIDGTSRTETDVNWTTLPLFHFNAAATNVLLTILVGGRSAVYPRFSLSNFWPEVERTGATVASLLGSMIPLIAEAPDSESSKRCYGQLRAIRGAPFPAPLQEKWKRRFGVKITGSHGYGLTEASLVTSLADGAYAAPGSSGRLNADFDVRIVDDHDNELPTGTAGEIVIRPKRAHVMFEGYWRRPEDTMKLMRNMWLHSGDIGKFDADGFFYFVDRKKDYLRRRAENISSFEMETTFRAHPAISDVAVHAVRSEQAEDDVKVTATLKPGVKLSEEELCKWSVDRLPYFAVPRYIEFREELPRNPAGRVLKYQLREQGCTPATWDREKSDLKLKKR